MGSTDLFKFYFNLAIIVKSGANLRWEKIISKAFFRKVYNNKEK